MTTFISRIKNTYEHFKSSRELTSLSEELSVFENCRVEIRSGVCSNSGKDLEFDATYIYDEDYYFNGGTLSDGMLAGLYYKISISNPYNYEDYFEFSFDSLSLDRVHFSEESGFPLFTINTGETSPDYQFLIITDDVLDEN